jgi:hypothetical protein
LTKRRAKGEGSVYKRKDDRYMSEYEDANGKKPYITARTKAEVRQKLDSGLSPRRVRYVHVTIRRTLKDAVRLQMLYRNVADAAIPPVKVKCFRLVYGLR